MSAPPAVDWTYPPELPDAAAYVYATTGRDLHAWLLPARGAPAAAPAIVFFFGGSWQNGSPAQFAAQGRYLSTRGVTSILIDYRVNSRDQTTLVESLADAELGFAWVVANATRLGIDPNRIGVAGGSAGGHLATMLALRAAPATLLLFNPVLVLTANHTSEAALVPPSLVEFIRAAPAPAVSFSPLHLIRGALPPTLIQHGRSDSVVPFASSEVFAERARAAGSDVVLVGYDDQDHGFFNFGRDGGWAFVATLRRADRFLSALGWTDGPPTLEVRSVG